MSDRYDSLSHQQLWKQLMAGNPEQVEGVASDWSSLQTTLNDLSATLDKDLERLRPSWTGSAGTEFQNRLDSIVKFSAALATDAADFGQALSLLAGPLREAQNKAEDPADTDDHGRTLGGAAIGGLLAGPAGAALGGVIGHKQDQQQKEDARRRMVTLVSKLAGEYMVAGGRVTGATEAPGNLPDSVRAPQNSPNSVPAGGGVPAGPRAGVLSTNEGKSGTQLSAVAMPPPATGTPGAPGGITVPGPAAPVPGPVPGTGATPGGAGVVPGTVLSGVPGGSGGTGGGTGLVGGGTGAGPARPAGGTVGGGGGLFGGGGPHLGNAGSLASGARPAGAGGDRPHPAAGRGVGQPGSGSTRTGGAGTIGGSAEAGSGRGGAGRAGGLPGQPGAGHGAHPVQSGMAGGNSRRGGQADEADEQLTWLTEDDLPWQHDDAAPPVLGADPR